MLRPLQPVSDLQISVWMEHPEPVAGGVHRRQFVLRVAQLQVEMGQEQKDESGRNKIRLVRHNTFRTELTNDVSTKTQNFQFEF